MTDEHLLDQLMYELRLAVPELTTSVDRSKAGHYVILKVSGKTIGYINGKRMKLRVDNPALDRKLLVTHPIQVPLAVEFLKEYLPEEAAA